MSGRLTTYGLFRRLRSKWPAFLCAFPALSLTDRCTVNQGSGEPTTGSPVPEELQGQWQSILTYIPGVYEGVIPVSDLNGTYGVFYYFTADGQYQIDLRALSSYFDFACTFNGHRQEWGTVEIVGTEFTFHPTHAFESDLDSCGESLYIDPAPTQTATVTVLSEFDATGWPNLRLIFADGQQIVLERCRDCG